MAFEAYSHAIASLALWGLWMIALSVLSTRGKVPKDRAESGLPKRDYSNEAYRRHRAFQNAIETSPAFISVVIAAILAGASPLVINICASAFLFSRFATAYVHIWTENQTMRSAFFGLGWLFIILMGLATLLKIFF